MGVPILAQYTIRSKQSYIFQTNKILEIVGASVNISNAWDVLFTCAANAGAKAEKCSSKTEFILSESLKKFSEGTLQMVELFRGGGNATVLFDSMESYIEVNKAFSFTLIKEYPGMIPMAVCTEYTGNYRKDYAALMEEAERKKNRMVPAVEQFILPFSQMDRNTFSPLSVKDRKGEKLSYESLSKRKAGIAVRDDDVKILDEMTTLRGEESLLAVVHADGNNMGSKIMDLLGEETGYDACVSKMRRFTATTANVFSTFGVEKMKECRDHLRRKYAGAKLSRKYYAFRMIIADGDDLTFVCNARFVMDYVKTYLNAVQSFRETTGTDWTYSSCAGICIFHSHYPFSKAYSIAEQACDSAKEKVHRVDHEGKQDPIEECWIDYHFIHSGLGGDLSELRKRQGTDECQARPWRIGVQGTAADEDFAKMEELAGILKEYKVSRGDVKTVGNAFEISHKEDAYRELDRVCGHHKGLKAKLDNMFAEKDRMLRTWYDLAEIYDLWFQEVKI